MGNLDRFWDKVLFTTNCWEWVGGKARGYGNFGLDGKTAYSHRFVYELYKGKIPDGLELDHLCRNHSCVNPDHLEAVTHKVNMSRGNSGLYQKQKTHCKRGHELSGDNLYIDKRRSFRECRTCRNNAILKQKYKLKYD